MRESLSQENINWLRVVVIVIWWLVANGNDSLILINQLRLILPLAVGSLSNCVDEEGAETLLYCYSEEREKKEESMNQRLVDRFEKGLQGG